MKHNKFGFEIGDVVILDFGHPNWSKVRIIEFTPLEIFAKVQSLNDPKIQWETMTNRLSPEKF